MSSDEAKTAPFDVHHGRYDRWLEAHRAESVFYREARFDSTAEVGELLRSAEPET